VKLDVYDVGPLLFGFTADSVLGPLSEVQQSLLPVINGLDEIVTERSQPIMLVPLFSSFTGSVVYHTLPLFGKLPPGVISFHCRSPVRAL